MIKHKDQTMQIMYYNYKKKTAFSTDYSDFISRTKEFLIKHGYGLHMHDYQNIIFNVKPIDSLDKKINVIKEYFDSLTNTSNKDFLKFENLDLYCVNKRHQCVWIIQYHNPILENRKKIYNAMFNCQYEWKFHFGNLPDEIYNTAFKLLCKKYKNNINEEYKEYFNTLKRYNLMHSIEHDSSNNFYNYIVELINLKTSY